MLIFKVFNEVINSYIYIYIKRTVRWNSYALAFGCVEQVDTCMRKCKPYTYTKFGKFRSAQREMNANDIDSNKLLFKYFLLDGFIKYLANVIGFRTKYG